MKLTAKKIVYSLFLILAFFTPLIFSSMTGELYEFPKMFFVYVVGSTIIAFFLVSRILSNKKEWKLPNKFVAAYFLATLLSVVFSTHLYTSVWGYYSRFNGGAISFLVFFGLYFVAINHFTDKGEEVLKDVFCLTLIPISLYGMFQISEVNVRIYSTLGQPNWLAAYIVFLLPLVIERILNTQDVLRKSFWMFTFITSFVALWFTRSLSGIAGMLVGFLYLLFMLKNKILNKFLLGILIILVVIVSVNFSYLRNRISDAIVISTDPESYRVSDPGLIRLGLWKGSLRMAVSDVKSFLIGRGPETFAYEFPFFREDFLNYSSEWNFILNKPHNYYLEILVESGAVTLIFYLLLIGYTLTRKNYYLAAGLLAFYVSNIFSWPTVSTSLLFWLWLAMLSRKETSP